MAFTTSASSETSHTPGISPGEKSFTVAIIGGGLAGVTLAIGLSKQGVPVHIYESAPAFSEIGAGVRCQPNVVKVLGLIDPRIAEGYWKCATFNLIGKHDLTFRWGQDCTKNGGDGKKAGDFIWDMRLEDKGHEEGKSITASSMHRAKFLDEMVKLLPEGLTSFGKRLTEAVELGDGVRLTFADGSSAKCSAVIGCDGIKSRMRQIMYPEMVPMFTGEYCYRGLIPMGEANEVLGEELAGDAQLYCGYGGYIITYPVDQGKLLNVVAIRRTEKKEWGDEQWIVPSSKEDMQRDFEGWEPKLFDLISRLENDRWAVFDVPPLESYAKGKMCLLGDAAHASTPHLGAGAGMAFEDAYIMSTILGALHDEKQVPAAFQAFDAARKARTRQVVLCSRQAGLANELLKEGVMDDLLELQKDIEVRYRWILELDFEVMRRESFTALNR